MIVVAAYLLTYGVAPLVGGLVGWIVLPLVSRASMQDMTRPGFVLLCSAVDSLVAVWVGTLIFTFIGETPGLGIVVVLGAGYALHDLRKGDWTGLSGALAGLGIGATLFELR